MPTSVLRRYTPPTCTLEIAATGSALSRWTDRTVLKNLHFQLSFDDPKLPPEKQVMIKGDRTQLEALCEAVGSYVQNLLNQPPEQIPLLSRQADLANRVDFGSAPLTDATAAGIHLQHKGLLAHDLWLGPLATAESGAAVQLSTLQLFDLANALDDYRAEALALPNLGRPSWLSAPRSWGIAAAAVLAIGATGAITKFVMDISTPTTQVSSAPRQAETSLDQSSQSYPKLSPPPALDAPPALTLQPVPLPPPTGQTQPQPTNLPTVGIPQKAPVNSALPPATTPSSLPNPTDGSQPQVAIIPAPANSAARTSQSLTLGQANTASPIPRLSTEGSGANSDGAAASSQAYRDNPIRTATASTAFDTIPQVAEVRSYFQQKWQPPSELTQTLEYRLLLNADGSIQRIVPLGQASENYIDRTNMPLMGEPFVSATQDGTSPQVRLVLEPNGKVKTFLEYAK